MVFFVIAILIGHNGSGRGNLDQLAKEGKIAINYHTAPTCSPARAAILTGVDWHVGGLGNMYVLS